MNGLFDHAESHYQTQETMKRWGKNVLVPWIEAKRLQYANNATTDEEKVKSLTRRFLLVLDNHSSHFASKFLEMCKTANIRVYFLPPNLTGILQPLDLNVNSPDKTFSFALYGDSYTNEIAKQRLEWRQKQKASGDASCFVAKNPLPRTAAGKRHFITQIIMAAHHRLSFERATIMKAWAMSGIYEAAFGHAFDETDGRYKNAGKDRSEYPIDLSQIAAVEAEIGSFPAFCAWSSDFSRASHFFLFKKLARRQNQQSKVRRERLLKWSTVRAQRRKTLKKNLTTMTPWMRKTNKVMRWTFLKVLKSRGTTELWWRNKPVTHFQNTTNLMANGALCKLHRKMWHLERDSSSPGRQALHGVLYASKTANTTILIASSVCGPHIIAWTRWSF